MPEPFPSKAYQELCITHQKELRGVWKPGFGDWVYFDDYVGKGVGIISALEDDPPYRYAVELKDDIGWRKVRMPAQGPIPLLTLRQLMGLLEERGYYPGVQKCRKPDEWWAGASRRAWDEWPHDADTTIQGLGPDPETAMLRAWLEVVKEER